MNTTKFKTSSKGHCKTSIRRPEEKSIQSVIKSARKRHLKGNAIIIARFNWLKRRKMLIPEDLTVPNLCLIIKEGDLDRAFYSETLTHIIKKLRYNIQILN